MSLERKKTCWQTIDIVLDMKCLLIDVCTNITVSDYVAKYSPDFFCPFSCLHIISVKRILGCDAKIKMNSKQKVNFLSFFYCILCRYRIICSYFWYTPGLRSSSSTLMEQDHCATWGLLALRLTTASMYFHVVRLLLLFSSNAKGSHCRSAACRSKATGCRPQPLQCQEHALT